MNEDFEKDLALALMRADAKIKEMRDSLLEQMQLKHAAETLRRQLDTLRATPGLGRPVIASDLEELTHYYVPAAPSEVR